jgi:hypothetical protein
MSSSMTETASQPDVTPLQPETGFSSSRDRVGIHRAQENGLFPQPLLVSCTQLDKLEERGYLDPDLRGNRVDECEAIEAFLIESLIRPSAGP